MKKLTYLVTAIAAAFTTSAHADVAISGSANVAYVNDVQGNGIGANGSAVVFSMSTTTANGIGMSTALSLTVDQDAEWCCCRWRTSCNFHNWWSYNRCW